MRVMVIGGTRFIGLETVTRLHALGHEVVVFHRGQTAAALPRNVQEILGDRYHLSDRAGQLKNLAPDVVLDMIPLGEEDTRAVVRVFTGVARRIVAIRSQDVFRAYGRLHETEIGPPEETPLTEEAPLRERFFPYRDAATDTDDPRYRYEKILWNGRSWAIQIFRARSCVCLQSTDGGIPSIVCSHI